MSEFSGELRSRRVDVSDDELGWMFIHVDVDEDLRRHVQATALRLSS